MRRTYRSKKETGGGMDPRDVVLAMDEKGSVFDAFYIENIKQTKRDLSVGASMFAASNKVRKRKYVKRLKDQEPIVRDTRESTSRSGYLTPDKSIHLKRELDPFDLLLNSSSTNEAPTKPSKINVGSDNPLHTRGKGRTYRKKAPCTKKFVYSSSEDTDSDKENSSNRSKSDETQNQSDILSHKLEIEKEEKIVSNKIDESIINIVTDLSLFNNFNSASPLSSTMKDKSSNASVQKSPICSTPFHKKYRAKFIYKFSPISVDTNDSKHYTIAENLEESTENKNELNNIPNTTVQFAYPYNKRVDYSEINSPILPSRDVIDKNRTKMLKHHHPITKEISLLHTSEQEPFLGFPLRKSWSIPNINLEAVNIKYLEREENNLEVLQQSQSKDLPNENINSNLVNKNNQNSSLENDNDASLNSVTIENQLVLAKPLENLISPKLVRDQLHFEDYEYHHDETEQSSVNRPEEDALSQTYLEKTSIVDNAHSLIKENTLESSQIHSAKNSIVEYEYSLNEENTSETSQIYSEPGASSSDENKHVLNYEDSSEDEMEQNTLESSQTRSEENSSIESGHNSVEESISGEEIEQNTSKQRTNSEENSTVENESSVTEQGTFNMSKDTESLYKSCNSENEISDIETDLSDKELLVVLERLNDSVLDKKYYNKEANSTGDSSQSDDINNESCSSENSNNIYTSLNEIDTLSESTKSTSNDKIEDDLQEDTLMNVSNIDQDVDFNDEINKSDDDVFVSFVTRRRRNEITKDSFILSFDNSLTSTSSSDFNKTVLTNTKPSNNSLEGNNDITLSNDVQEQTDGVLVDKSQICDGDISLLQCENTIIETELSPLPKIKSAGVVSKKSAVISRQSAKLSAENLSRESDTTENDLNSRKNVASKVSTAKSRKSSKLSTLTDNINREFCSEISDSTSRNSVTSKQSAVNTRKSSKLSTNKVDKESINEKSDRTSGHIVASKKSAVTARKSNKLSDNNINNDFSKETNDCTSRNSLIVPGTNIMTRKSSRLYQESVNTNCFAETLSPPKCDINPCHDTVNDMSEIKQGIVLEPGKRWERSLSIYRRVTTMGDHFDQSMLDDKQLINKGRMYRQSVMSTMEMQDTTVSLHKESVKSRRSTLFSKPSRSTIKILRESNASRISLSSTSTSEDLGFLSEDCDDTLVQLSKLSIIDSDHEVTVLDKFNDTSSRITTARDYVLRRCNQTDVIPFDECYPDTLLKNCRKIGEGVYGEVFLWRARDGRARVLKVVPIAGSTKVNGESQKDYHEIISEIVIAMELSALRAPIIEIEKHLDEGQGVETLDLHSVENATDVFNEVLAVRCVYGSYPSRLLDLWELYDECKGSENDNPAILPADQQFMVLELANAGQDLESYQFHNAEQAFALFQQVAFGLAVAEEAFQFEHRDLHWGNVLIAPTDQKYATFVLRGRAHRVARRGVAATIIDYSLSRLSLRLPADTAALYNDLATDDGLFDAVGDYQFQVYRLMRDKLGNDWKNFEPYTNILWLHYTVDKMITALRYTRTNTKIHKHYIAKLKEIKNRILDYGSAVQYVLTDNEI